MTNTTTPLTDTTDEPNDTETIVSRVREEYAHIARRGGTDDESCCSPTCCSPNSQRFGYAITDIEALPSGADMGLGCGAPISALELRPGEVVLDLGSGGGIDVFLAARQVASTGSVIGVDMTPEMIDLARQAARQGGYTNVEFRRGRLEKLPVDDESIDAVTSNCVINLVPDKRTVFAEIARVLRPGGRVVVSDLVLERQLPEALVRELGAGSCITTAVSRSEYLEALRSVGLGEPEILADVDYLAAAGWTGAQHLNEESRAVLERIGVCFEQIEGAVHSITVRARKPPAPVTQDAREADRPAD
jgi:SAM-dependent methyltransferase